MTPKLIDTFEVREFDYLIALRHLEETARIQKLVYTAQLAEINEKIERDAEAERNELIDNHPINTDPDSIINPTQPAFIFPLPQQKRQMTLEADQITPPAGID